MHIGIVAENYFPTLGGIQEHIRHLKNFLTREGIRVTIFTGRPQIDRAGPAPADGDDCVRRVGDAVRYGIGGTVTQATLSPAAALRLRRFLREDPIDLMNIHGPCDIGLPMIAHALYRGPKVLTLHSCFPDARWRHVVAPYYRRIFASAKSIVAVSEATRDAMRRYASFEAEIVPNGVDCRYWEAGRPAARYRRPGARNILYLGRLEARNGFDILLEAFVGIADAHPEARLLVAGDGPLRATYEAAVPDRLRTRIDFLGAVYDERPDLFASSDLFVIPARAVGFSIMVLEAFAGGLPVVAAPGLGVSAAGGHWENVSIAEALEPASLGRTIVAALGSDQRARIERGRAIAYTYDWSAIGPRLLDVFRRAAGAKVARAA